MKQTTVEFFSMIIACVIVIAAFGMISFGDDLPEQDAKESGGNIWDLYECGVTMEIPEGFEKYKDKVTALPSAGALDDGIVYAEIDVFLKGEEEVAAMSDEELYMALYEVDNVIPLMMIIGMDGGRGEVEFNAQQKMLGNDTYFNFEQIGEAAGYTFYNVTFDMEVPDIEDEELLAIVDEIKEQMEEARAGIVFSDPEEYLTVKEGTKVTFVTTDLDGNEVKSEDVFGKNIITMVNLWTSWCTWCVKEMPELEELNKELEEKGCGIIGILLDGDDEYALQDAKEIIEMTGATYLMLMPFEDVDRVLPSQAYPTTYFVDSEGCVVGSPVIGADIEGYKAQIEELLAAME